MELPIINGCECIPLRLIRFFTCSRFSADVLLRHLCHDAGPEHQPLNAYNIGGEKIPYAAWLDFARLVQSLSETSNLSDGQWIEESNSSLPAGTFVWRDEFETYIKYWQPEEYDSFSSPIIVPDKLKKSVWEGFEDHSIFEQAVADSEPSKRHVIRQEEPYLDTKPEGNVADNGGEVAAVETDKELCERLKLKGLSNKAIATELKRVFPTLTPHKIGKLTTEVFGIFVTSEAYRGRGRNLLK